MKVRKVLERYNKIVPFPWSVSKIEQAGYNPAILLMGIGKALDECEDRGDAILEVFSSQLDKLKEALEHP